MCMPVFAQDRLGILDYHRNEKRHAVFLLVFLNFFSEIIMTQDSVSKEWLFACWCNQQTKVILMTYTTERITVRTNVFGLHYYDWPDWTTWNVGLITNDTMTALYKWAHWHIPKCASVNQAWVLLNKLVAIFLSEKRRKSLNVWEIGRGVRNAFRQIRNGTAFQWSSKKRGLLKA